MMLAPLTFTLADTNEKIAIDAFDISQIKEVKVDEGQLLRVRVSYVPVRDETSIEVHAEFEDVLKRIEGARDSQMRPEEEHDDADWWKDDQN